MDARTVIALVVVFAAAVPGVSGTVVAQTGDSCSFPHSQVDATGTEVTIENDPERIVTLGPSAAQTIWEIGARDKVVGVTKYSSYLEGTDGKENVSGGGQQYVVAEKVVALEPDLVLAPNIIDNETVGQLRDAGLTVFRFEVATSIDFVVQKTRLTGQLVGECEGADETATWMETRIDTVREAVEGEERPNALYVFFGFTANEGTFVHELITTAGGENVAANADLEGPYPQISNEIVANSTIDWLLLNSDGPTVPDNEAYNSTRAVQEGNTLVLDGNYISQPAPRIVYPLVALAEAFHPDAYAEANATVTSSETTAGTDDRTGSTGQPGFGIVVALLAIVVTSVVARASR